MPPAKNNFEPLSMNDMVNVNSAEEAGEKLSTD